MKLNWESDTSVNFIQLQEEDTPLHTHTPAVVCIHHVGDKISSGINLEKWHFTFNLLNIYWKTVKLHESTVALQWECMQHIISKSYQTPTLKKVKGVQSMLKRKKWLNSVQQLTTGNRCYLFPTTRIMSFQTYLPFGRRFEHCHWLSLHNYQYYIAAVK